MSLPMSAPLITVDVLELDVRRVPLPLELAGERVLVTSSAGDVFCPLEVEIADGRAFVTLPCRADPTARRLFVQPISTRAVTDREAA